MYYRDKIKDISNTKGSKNFPVVVWCLNVPSSTPEKEKKIAATNWAGTSLALYLGRRKKQFSPDLHFVRQIQPFSININFLLILNFNACHSNEVVSYNIMSFELPLIISLKKMYEWFLSTILYRVYSIWLPLKTLYCRMLTIILFFFCPCIAQQCQGLASQLSYLSNGALKVVYFSFLQWFLEFKCYEAQKKIIYQLNPDQTHFTRLAPF